MARISLVSGALALLLFVPNVWAESVQEERHELMETAKDAAKAVGGMLKGEKAFDADVAMESFKTWDHVATTAGAMFPEGSETGYDTRAMAAVWADREGFDTEMAAFAKAVTAAIEAAPQDLEALKPAAGPIFKTCKSCHETYRAEED